MTRCRTELADFKTFGIDLRVSISALRLPKPLDLYIQRAPQSTSTSTKQSAPNSLSIFLPD